MNDCELLAVAYRGDIVESRHFGSVVVVDKTGKILYSRGNPERMTFLRSAAKPFQVLPLFETGAAEAFEFSQDEIAVMCGSHSGEDMHVQRIESILKKIGLDESNLQCGIQRPFHKPTAQRLMQANERISQLRNACSGKHSCMLAITRHKDWDLGNYIDLTHPVQQLMLNTVAQMTEYPASQIATGLDTCGVPVFAVPLKNMALGYANLTNLEKYSGSRQDGIQEIQKAMGNFPELIAGTGRFTTDLLKATDKKFVAKDGAEASFGIGVIPEGIGIAVKIEDGSERALPQVVMQILMELGSIDESTVNKLNKFKARIVKTYGGVPAGKIQAVKLF